MWQLDGASERARIGLLTLPCLSHLSLNCRSGSVSAPRREWAECWYLSNLQGPDNAVRSTLRPRQGSPKCMEQEQARWPEASAQAQGDLDDPHSAPARQADSGSGTFQRSHRQQAQGLRSRLRLRVGDVAHGGRIVARATVVQCKTRQPVPFELTEQTRDAVHAGIVQARLQAEGYLFPSRVSRLPHLSTRQYARIVKGVGFAYRVRP